MSQNSGFSAIIGFVLFIIVFSFTGCEDNFNWFRSNEKLLTRTLWERESCINNTTNTAIETGYATYDFREDGTYILTPADSLSPQYGTWEFVDNEKYLKIGANTFKIQNLTKKIFVLRYGDMDFFYIPLEE